LGRLAVVATPDLRVGLQEKPGPADIWEDDVPQEEVAVKQLQITRTRRPTAPVEIDTRTPSGRVLPF